MFVAGAPTELVGGPSLGFGWSILLGWQLIWAITGSGHGFPWHGEVQLFGGQLVESNPRLEGKDLGYFSSHYQVRMESHIKHRPKNTKHHRKFRNGPK